MNGQFYANNTIAVSANPGLATRPTIEGQLHDRKFRLETELTEVNEAIAALAANPEMTKVIETLAKTIRNY